jgi:hypothetical protein
MALTEGLNQAAFQKLIHATAASLHRQNLFSPDSLAPPSMHDSSITPPPSTTIMHYLRQTTYSESRPLQMGRPQQNPMSADRR